MTLLDNVFSKNSNELSLKNKTALITGASAGIGLATSAWLAREGVHLILVARRGEKLEELKKELSVKFPTIQIKTIALDLTKKGFIDELKSQNAFDVDIFINNAGLALGKNMIVDLIEEDIDKMIETNVTSSFKLASAVAKNMVQKGSGHIINLGSIAGHYPYEGGSVYCATKFAVRAFTQSLRQEMHDKNVRVSLVSPGIVKTDFSVVRFKGDVEKAAQVYEGMECLEASDIARVILKILKEPVHVNLDEVIVLPTVQAPVSNRVKKTN
jgi:NADP-dependent 3-hydroxy acid dehydrogenase YdfG